MSIINFILVKRFFVGIKICVCGFGGFIVNIEIFGWIVINVVFSGLVGICIVVCR